MASRILNTFVITPTGAGLTLPMISPSQQAARFPRSFGAQMVLRFGYQNNPSNIGPLRDASQFDISSQSAHLSAQHYTHHHLYHTTMWNGVQVYEIFCLTPFTI